MILLLGIRFPPIWYNVQFEKSFITILIKSNHLMCHHSSNYIPGMNINGDQGTQDVSCKFRKLSTNQGCQFVQVLGKTKIQSLPLFIQSLLSRLRILLESERHVFVSIKTRKKHVPAENIDTFASRFPNKKPVCALPLTRFIFNI